MRTNFKVNTLTRFYYDLSESLRTIKYVLDKKIIFFEKKKESHH